MPCGETVSSLIVFVEFESLLTAYTAHRRCLSHEYCLLNANIYPVHVCTCPVDVLIIVCVCVCCVCVCCVCV